MSDLISRQALHERINETVNEGLIFSGMTIAEFIEALIDSMPSAERVGHWVLVKGSNGKDYHKCSECLHTQEITGVKNYCAVCGARMVGDEE